MTTTSTRLGEFAFPRFPNLVKSRDEWPFIYHVEFHCPQGGRLTGTVIGVLHDITNGAETVLVELTHLLPGIVRHVHTHDILHVSIDFYRPSISN